ncbi:hypothetical protein CAI21_13885 [Alkalilimnicola ehrlichii]|uniref:Alpha-L-glutamate ligase-related protein ATP-grasp domain-containing protein n=1 Tax=Alkalilimnicola ehrlichii TaxID=351052 RepID=A0A3E0WNX0_9GAMM|nr:sugar-transfer associated ATP-grasp domain-containing protein [Alkalilimnicola ehrlichii]RFA28001.1 hypothetical protein CAI21_13885 [Alkalilimnicola ehrlichii]RFA34652.1 hypothetical protein CAL65_14925 [Alkalilimnicola ehrlichii]
MYTFDRDDPECFLSDLQRWMTQLINGKFAVVFNNKVLFTQVFRNFCRIPEIVAIWRSERVIPYSPVWNQIKSGQLEEPVRLVAKPLGGGGGGNIYFIRAGRQSVVVESNDPEAARRRRYPPAEIDSLFEGKRVPFMVTEYIEQGSFSKALFPLTVNTLRILVVRDPETLEPHIVRAVLRVGTSASYPIDNFSYGGLSVAIDLASGVLGKAVAAAGPYAGRNIEQHPDTGERLQGLAIPNWREITERVRYLFCAFPILLIADSTLLFEIKISLLSRVIALARFDFFKCTSRC